MTTEFKHGTSFWESRKSCGRDNGGCRDSELAGMSAAVTWVLRDITVFPPQGPRPKVLRMTRRTNKDPWEVWQSSNKRLIEALRDKRGTGCRVEHQHFQHH